MYPKNNQNQLRSSDASGDPNILRVSDSVPQSDSLEYSSISPVTIETNGPINNLTPATTSSAPAQLNLADPPPLHPKPYPKLLTVFIVLLLVFAIFGGVYIYNQAKHTTKLASALPSGSSLKTLSVTSPSSQLLTINTHLRVNSSSLLNGNLNLKGSLSVIGNSDFSGNLTAHVINATDLSGNFSGNGSSIFLLNGSNISKGTVGVSYGGTGNSSFNAYGLLYGNGTAALQSTMAGVSGDCLVANNNTPPTWNSCVNASKGSIPGGNAGGDLTGTYPNPTIAKLQGNSVAISSVASGQVLQWNGVAFINSLVTNANLTIGNYPNITGTGILTTGSIASGFGLISTSNNITTTSIAQASIVNATSMIELNGTNIDTAGTLNNLAYLNQANTFTNTNNLTASGIALSVTNSVSVGGTTTTGSLNVTGSSSVGATLDVGGSTTLNSTLNVAGASTFAGSVETGTATFGGLLILQDGSNHAVSLLSATQTNSVTLTIPADTNTTDAICLKTLANCGVNIIGALDGGTANANGATISGTTLYLQSASVSYPGLINTIAQSFAGNKTFSGSLSVNGSSIFEDLTNSTTAFQVQNASASTILDVDTSNGRVGIGTTSPAYTLDVAGSLNGTTIYQNGSQVCDNSNNCNYAASGGDANYIQNTTSAQSASFNVTGTGTAGTLNGTTIYQNGSQVCDNSNNCNYAASGGDANYIQNTTSAQSASFNVTGTGTVGGTLIAGELNGGGGSLGTSAGDGYLMSYLHGYASNNVQLQTFLERTSNGTDWTTTSLVLQRYTDVTAQAELAFWGNNICIDAGECNNTLGVSGTIGASGSITANTTPDISETIPTASNVVPQDVVSADPNRSIYAIQSQKAYDPSAIGVISNGTSSFKINSNGGSSGAAPTGQYLVLAGRVPVNVTNQGGSIVPGDYLTTSSTPGYAMKADHAGPTIGKALGYFNGAKGSVMVQTNLSYWGGPSNNLTISNSGSSVSNLTVTGNATLGNVTVNGSVNVTNTSSYAVDVTASDPSSVNAGNLVSLDINNPGDVVLASGNYDPNLLGVIATNPGFVAGQGTSGSNAKPLALSGIVPVKVDGQNGPIKPGDYITCSAVPGYGMKASEPGQVVGVATTSFSGSGTSAHGTVQVFIKYEYYNPGSASVLQGSNPVIDSLTVNGSINASSINVSSAHISDLSVSGNASVAYNLSVGGNLSVAGMATVGGLTVNGHIVSSGNVPLAQVLPGAGTGASVSINGNDTSGTITITTGGQMSSINNKGQTVLSGTNPIAGDVAALSFASSYAQAPHILLTPNDAASAGLLVYPDQQAISGFSVGISDTPKPFTTYTFEYFVIQ